MKSVILITACCLMAVLLSGTVVSAEKARFDNYRIYSVKIGTVEQLMLLQDIDSHLDGVSTYTHNIIGGLCSASTLAE